MVTLGLGAAAVSLGGPPGGRNMPQMELFSVERAIINGFPMFEPSPEQHPGPSKWPSSPVPSLP
jgi:hypothetical protein